MTTWKEDIDHYHKLLLDVSFSDKTGSALDAEAGFRVWRERTEKLRDVGHTIYFIGNGASASMASHFAADMAKNAHLHTQTFTDLSLITAISNDMGYEHVFAEPLRRRGKRGDMLLAISSSGKSPNILAAVDIAQQLNLTVITLSAMNADNPLRKKGELNIYVSAQNYGWAETCHAAILHRWMDMMEIKI